MFARGEKFLLNCFLEAYDKNGQIDHSKIVNKHKAVDRLEIKIEKNGWGQKQNAVFKNWWTLLTVQEVN